MQSSPVVVSDRPSLMQNFSENAVNFVCDTTFATGSYAIGGSLLGLAKLTPPGRLITGAALLGAMAFCPARPNSDSIFGAPANFVGGQCIATYNWRLDYQLKTGGPTTTFRDGAAQGPIRVFELFKKLDDGVRPVWYFRVQGHNDAVPREISTTLNDNVVTVSNPGLYIFDGRPDDCGNRPLEGGQVITNIVEGDTIDNSKVVDNRDYSVTVPVQFSFGGYSSVLNLRFGDLVIKSLLPLSFNLNIGGSNFSFEEDEDGAVKPTKTNPDPDGVESRIEELLKQIKECVCRPEVDLDLLYVPVVNSSESCTIKDIELLVPKGSVSFSSVDAFRRTASDARSYCLSKLVEQLPEKQIFAATVTSGGKEIFTGEIDTDVVSLRIKIDNYDEALLPKIGLFPDSNQHKFGSVAFVTSGVEGGGAYQYVYDTDTYVPLPKRGKKGRLRVLMKSTISFRIFDTGERLE